MKETELIDAVKAVYKVTEGSVVELQKSVDNVSINQMNVLVTDGDKALQQNVIYYVVDKGTAEEKAYYMDGRVQFDPASVGL